MEITGVTIIEGKYADVITIGWIRDIGYGEITIIRKPLNEIIIEMEHMNKDHFLQVMSALYDKAEILSSLRFTKAIALA